jgi:hypothetical protein
MRVPGWTSTARPKSQLLVGNAMKIQVGKHGQKKQLWHKFLLLLGKIWEILA